MQTYSLKVDLKPFKGDVVKLSPFFYHQDPAVGNVFGKQLFLWASLVERHIHDHLVFVWRGYCIYARRLELDANGVRWKGWVADGRRWWWKWSGWAWRWSAGDYPGRFDVGGAGYDEGGVCTSCVEGCPDGSFEVTSPIVVRHSRAKHRTRESYTTLHAGGKIGAGGRRNVNVDDIVVNIAAHDENIAVGFEGVSVGIGTDGGCLRDIAR